MNVPVRHLAVLVVILFGALLLAGSRVQYLDASSLAKGPRNTRTFYRQFDKPRGAILVDGKAVAKSVKSDDAYGYQRVYPQKKLYAAVTGYLSVVYGRSALESAEDSLLDGSDDSLFYRRVHDILTGEEAQGASVELTISAKAQKAAWDALGDQRGAVVAMDPTTGAILAMVSKPSYDPNTLASHDTASVRKAWATLTSRSDDPLVNRAIAGDLYPPGSVFKVVTSAAALETGRYTKDTLVPGPATLDLPGTTTNLPNDFAGACGANGQVTLARALAISCNTAYGSLGLTLGQDKLRAQAEAFGFGQKLSIPLTVTPSVFPADMTRASTAQSAIGQFSVRVTPLQIALVTAAVANNGVMMKPYLVKEVRSADLTVLKQASSETLGTPISADTASQLTSMMKGVVTSGTGTAAQIPGVSVAGKTGTAQQGNGKSPHAWFTSFAPSGNPKVVVTVVVEDGGNAGDAASGGRVAAPIARKVLEAVLGS